MNNGNINEIADFKQLSQLTTPKGTTLAITLQNGKTLTATITHHYNEYDDPLEQKYKLNTNGTTAYLHINNLKVQLTKEDADGLPLGTGKTVTQITQH